MDELINLNEVIKSHNEKVDLSMSDLLRSNMETFELSSDISPFSLSLRISKFEDEKAYIQFVKNCEKLSRQSLEYNFWRKYIKDILGETVCHLTFENSVETDIHIHHHIPDIFTIIKAIVNKKLNNEQSFCTFDICTEAIELHFKNGIGFVPLIESLHTKFHNGFLKIPIEIVSGNYSYFLENYSQFLDEEDIAILDERLAVKQKDVEIKWSKDFYPGMMIQASGGI